MRAVFAGFEPAALVYSPGRSVQRSNRALTASEEVSGRITGKGPWSPSGPTLSRRIGARLLQPRCPDAARDGSWWNKVSPPSLPGNLVGEAGFAPARAMAHEFLRLACMLIPPLAEILVEEAGFAPA